MKYGKWMPLNEAIKEYASGFEEDQLHSPSTKKVIPPRDEEEEDESLDEITPPGFPEKLIHRLKRQYPGHKKKAYATAWMLHKKYGDRLQEMYEAYEEEEQEEGQLDEAEYEDKPKKLPLRKALGKYYPKEEPLDLPKTQKRIYQTIRPEEEPKKVDETEEREKTTHQAVKKQYFDPKTKTMKDIDWIQKVEPKTAEKSEEEVDESSRGGFQSVGRSARTSDDQPQNNITGFESDDQVVYEEEEQEEGRLDESVRNRLMKNAGIKKKADKKLDEYFYYYYNPETGKVEKKSELHNPKTSPYLGPKASGERPMITKSPEGGHKMTFVPSDLPKQPGEVDEAEETGFRRVVSRPKMTASPEDVEKWSKELQATKPHSEEPFIKTGEEYLKAKYPSAYIKHQAKKSEKQSTDFVNKLRNQARKELFGTEDDVEEAVQRRSYRTGDDLPEGYEEMDEETGTGAVAGYQTPFAFGKGDQTQSRAMKANKSIGYEPVGKKLDEYGNPAHYQVPEMELDELAYNLREFLSKASVDNVSVSPMVEKDVPKHIGKSILVDFSDKATTPKYYVFITPSEPHSLHMLDEESESVYEQGGLSLDEVKKKLIDISEWIEENVQPEEEEEEIKLDETPYGRKEIKHPVPPVAPMNESLVEKYNKVKKILEG